MSLWSNFTKALTGAIGDVTGIRPAVNALKTIAPVVEPIVKPVAKVVGNTASGVAQGIKATGYVPGGGPGGPIAQAGSQIASGMVAQQAAKSGVELTAKAQNAMTDVLTSNSVKQVNQVDPLLTVAAATEEKVFTPLVKRPIATAALLADPNSPLYDAGKFGEGLQASDVVDAYNRTGATYKTVNGQKVLVSEGVSLGQALTKAVLNPAIHLVGLDAQVKAAGLNLDKVNLWDDKSIQENFVDNTLGRYMSGITDAVVGNAAIQGAVSGGLAGLKFAANAAGFTNKLKLTDINALADLEAKADTHFAGTEKTVFGSDMEYLAQEKDINKILDVVSPTGGEVRGYSNNPKIAKLIQETNDPAVVRDFILADKGYGPAIERLTQLNRADDLWILGDSSKEISGYYATNGKMPDYTFEQRQRISKAFDDAIAKDPKHQEIFDAFMRDTTVKEVTPAMAARGIEPGMNDITPRLFGKNYVPMEPVVGKELYTKARRAATQARVAVQTRDYSNYGRVTQVIIGRSGAGTVLTRFVTTKLPRGIVTNSGVRPMDAIEEINAHFDAIKDFTNGTNLITVSATESISASAYRTQFISKYLDAKTDAARGLVLDELNKKLIVDVARTRGITNISYIEKMVDEAMTELRKKHDGLANSYSMDPSGVREMLDPDSQRLVRNATPLLPVGEIVDQFFGNKVLNIAKDGTRTVYEVGNRAFSFTQLAIRPSYIGKNSLLEPTIVSFASQGHKVLTESAKTYTKRVLEDNTNKVIKNLKKAKNLTNPQRAKLIDSYQKLSEQYGRSLELLDDATAEYIEFFRTPAGRSPATQAEYSDLVLRDLRAAERQVRDLEVQMNIAAPEFSKDFTKIPSLYNLTRRIDFIKNNAPEELLAGLKKPQPGLIKDNQKRVQAFYKAQGSPIASAENAIKDAAERISQLTPDLEDVNLAIATQYKELEDLIQSTSILNKELEGQFSVADGKLIDLQKQDTFNITMPNGETIPIPNFSNAQYMGKNFEAEIANTHTRQIELTGDKIFGTKINKFIRKSPSDATNITSEAYFDELAYIVNNHMRGDILIDRILAGESRESLLANWAGSRQAATYASEFGKSADDIVKIIDSRISYVNRYLPSVEVQAAAAKGEVSASVLRRNLADNPSALTPIHPLEVDYAFPTNKKQRFMDGVDRAVTVAWQTMATPENKIRYAWANTRYKEIASQKVEQLYAQGYEVIPSMVDGIRQAAVAETIKELEKTFYSIRRQNRALFAARTIAAFPTATASGVYRYARIAINNPSRTSAFLNSYYGLYNSFGLDANGNPVQDPRDAKYFLVPGTKEMGINKGAGLVMPKTSTMFMINNFSAGYTVPISLGAIYNAWRGSDKVIKSIVDKTIGHIPGYSYDELFPYGVETNVLKQTVSTFQPAWYKNLNKYLNGGPAQADFRNSMLSEYKYQAVLWQSGLGPKPTNESVLKATQKKYGMKAAWQFFSIVGSAPQIDMQPGAIFQNVFNAKADEYLAQKNADGSQKYTREQAAQLAEDFLNTKMALPKGTVSRQVLQQQMSSNKFYMPATQETINRIWDDHTGLFDELYAMDKSLPGLMTADLPLGTDPQVRKFISDPNRTLPGGDTLKSDVKSVTQLNNELEASQFWKAYTDTKNSWNEAAKKAGYASYRSVPELVQGLKDYANTLAKASKAFAVSWDKAETGDSAALWTDGLVTALNNTKYQSTIGKGSQFWEHARALVSYRNAYAEAYANAPSGSKFVIQNSWQNYLESSLTQWDPTLQRVISRYFLNDKLKQTKITLKEETK